MTSAFNEMMAGDERGAVVLPDPMTLAIQARAARDEYVGRLIVSGVRSLYSRVLRPVVAAVTGPLARRRTIAEIRELDSHMLADIGVDATALATGVLRRRADDINSGLGGPVIWPTKPAHHSAPRGDMLPPATAANDRASDRRVA